MATLKKSLATWKRKVNGFEKTINQIKVAFTNGTIVDMEYGEQQLKDVNLKWDILEEAYDRFEDDFPRAQEPVLVQPDVALRQGQQHICRLQSGGQQGSG